MEENAATDLECDFMRPAEVRRASEDREAAVSMIRSRYQGPGGRFELLAGRLFWRLNAEHLLSRGMVKAIRIAIVQGTLHTNIVYVKSWYSK